MNQPISPAPGVIAGFELLEGWIRGLLAVKLHYPAATLSSRRT